MQTSGICAEMFLWAGGNRETVIGWVEQFGLVQWAEKNSPYGHYDLLVLPVFSEVELLASVKRVLAVFRDVDQVRMMGNVIQAHLDSIDVGESALIYREPSLGHLSIGQLREMVDAELAAEAN